MSTSKYGALRKWFLAAQDSGDYIGIRYGFIKEGSSTPEWIYLPHTDFDGIGAFAEILRSRGVVLGALPQIKYYPAYSAVMSALKHWPRYALPRQPLRWQEMRAETIRRDDVQHAGPTYLGALRALMLSFLRIGRSNMWRQFAAVKAKALVIHGRRDVLVNPRSAHDVTRQLPGSTVVVLNNAGHVAQMEFPDEVARLWRETFD